jgi:hypothetical protein
LKLEAKQRKELREKLYSNKVDEPVKVFPKLEDFFKNSPVKKKITVVEPEVKKVSNLRSKIDDPGLSMIMHNNTFATVESELAGNLFIGDGKRSIFDEAMNVKGNLDIYNSRDSR